MAKLPSFLIGVGLSVTFLLISANAAPGPNPAPSFTYVCDPARFAALKLRMSNFSFCDAKLPYPVRAKDLVERMTLTEKVQQLGDLAYGVPRLGLPLYEWWSEALHGVSNVGRRTNTPPGTYFDFLVPGATSFPTVIQTTASFNESLWKRIGQIVSTEARAMYNLGRAGLTFWSPNINVVRDPRWGRITETPGEDPFIIGRYAVNYVKGLQDVEGHETSTDLHPRPLKVAACCKHYAAYDLDNWKGFDRFHFDARVTEQDLVETFLLPFQVCVKEGDVSSVMCSYNRVNGIPPCADPKFLTQTIRTKWNLHGYVVSDCDSLQVMVDGHKYLNFTKEDAVAQALKAGLDLDCGDYYTNYTESAVKQKKVTEAEINRSLNYLYIVLMRLGWFDGNPQYKSLGKNDVCSPQNIGLAAEAARQGIVLLKNDNGVLPLNNTMIKTLAVVGPNANATLTMIGNYAGIPCRYISPLNGFSSYAKVNYAVGCFDIVCKNNSLVSQAKDAARHSDATIIVAGLDLSIEAEGLDRVNLLLPGFQTQLIEQVADAAKGPVVLVMMCAGGVDISFAKINPKIQAILWVGYPGEEGGLAIADVVFGKYSPGGRLPITWYQDDYVNQIPYTSMALRPVGDLPGRTYKFYNGSVVYPFGFGLSYTRFKYIVPPSKRSVDIKLHKNQKCFEVKYTNGAPHGKCAAVLTDDLKCDDYFKFPMQVRNVGKMDGNVVVIVYSKPPPIAGTHLKQVIGFQRVFLPTGRSAKLSFAVNVCSSFRIVDSAGRSLLPSGEHTIIVGDGLLSFPVQVNLN